MRTDSPSRKNDPVALTELTVGALARLEGSDLSAGDVALLQALGLTASCRFRVCKAGNPWIVQVRDTRIGLAAEIARRLVVVSEATA